MALKIVLAAVIGMLLCGLTGCALPKQYHCWHANTNDPCRLI